MYYMGSRLPKGKGEFLGVFQSIESIVGHCCCVCSRKINKGISAIAAAHCIDPDWLVPLTFSPVINLPPPVIHRGSTFDHMFNFAAPISHSNG